MNRETSAQITAQGNMLTEQLEHDRKMRAIERLHNLMIQGAKGLGILNGGAAVAVLAFVQAMVGKDSYSALKPYAISALLLFLFGAFLSGIAFFFHYAYVNRSNSEKRNPNLWRRLFWGIISVSAICALAGGTLITGGICKVG